MACVGNDNPCFIAGDDVIYSLQFFESDGETAINLTGATAKMDLRVSVTNASVVQAMSGGIVSALLGQMEFTLTDAETATLLPRATESTSWAFSVKITYSDASEETILAGTFTLDQAATA